MGQRLALGMAVIMALVLAAYGAVGSYSTISDAAARVGVPFPQLVPIGVDGGLVGVVALDLILAWTGHPIGWLRQLTRLLTIGTVAANIAAGWPNPLAVGLHAAAPVMLLAMVEAGRGVLLRRAGLASGLARDRIPFRRWILSPCRTWSLWRRMILWQITSYHDALTIEANIRRAHNSRSTTAATGNERHPQTSSGCSPWLPSPRRPATASPPSPRPTPTPLSHKRAAQPYPRAPLHRG